MEQWTEEYLVSKMEERLVEITVTENGLRLCSFGWRQGIDRIDCIGMQMR